MAASEWTELESLTQAIADLRTRQEAAQSVESHNVVETIEQEIAHVEERRNQLLADLATGVVEAEESKGDGVTGGQVAVETHRAVTPGMAWGELTAVDVQRAKDDVNLRRTETLARHAAELSALDADCAEVDTLEQAIVSFIGKFTPPSAEVVPRKQERNLRQ